MSKTRRLVTYVVDDEGRGSIINAIAHVLCSELKEEDREHWTKNEYYESKADSEIRDIIHDPKNNEKFAETGIPEKLAEKIEEVIEEDVDEHIEEMNGDAIEKTVRDIIHDYLNPTNPEHFSIDKRNGLQYSYYECLQLIFNSKVKHENTFYYTLGYQATQEYLRILVAINPLLTGALEHFASVIKVRDFLNKISSDAFLQIDEWWKIHKYAEKFFLFHMLFINSEITNNIENSEKELTLELESSASLEKYVEIAEARAAIQKQGRDLFDMIMVIMRNIYKGYFNVFPQDDPDAFSEEVEEEKEEKSKTIEMKKHKKCVEISCEACKKRRDREEERGLIMRRERRRLFPREYYDL